MKICGVVAAGLIQGALLMSPVFCIGAGISEMTYQGRLVDGGRAATGAYDFNVSLYDTAAGPTNRVAGPVALNAVKVENGLFHLPLNFGSVPFSEEDRWLEISVRTNGGGAFVALQPRHALKASPYAITAGQILAGGIPSGVYTNALTLENPANRMAGDFSGNGAGLTNLPLAGLSASARNSITNIARDKAESAVTNLSADQLRGYGRAPSFTATSPTQASEFFGPIFLQSTNLNSRGGALHIYQPAYDGPVPIMIEGAYRDDSATERYLTYFGPGNPGMWSNGYIILDGGIDSPPFHNPPMLGIYTDVPVSMELVNQFSTTNAFHIEASGPWLASESIHPVVFSVSSRGQMSLINPYGSSYSEPQLILTDATTADDSTFSLRSRAGTLSMGTFDTINRVEKPVLSISDGQVGIGTLAPRAHLDVRGRTYLPTNSAPFSVTRGTNRTITNSNNRSQIVLQISFGRQGNGLPSCSIISTNLLSTNSYVISPLPSGASTASVTNLYTLPVQTNSVIVIRDTSTTPAFISLISYELFGH